MKYEAVNNKLQMYIEVQLPKLCSHCLLFSLGSSATTHLLVPLFSVIQKVM